MIEIYIQTVTSIYRLALFGPIMGDYPFSRDALTLEKVQLRHDYLPAGAEKSTVWPGPISMIGTPTVVSRRSDILNPYLWSQDGESQVPPEGELFLRWRETNEIVRESTPIEAFGFAWDKGKRKVESPRYDVLKFLVLVNRWTGATAPFLATAIPGGGLEPIEIASSADL